MQLKKILALSPHLDDAIFSVGGILALLNQQNCDVHVVTCFTASVPNPVGFALECQLSKGISESVDYMELRRQEDYSACTSIGARATWLPLPEAPHRGYTNAQMLFSSCLPEDMIEEDLYVQLQTHIKDNHPDLILYPKGIGNHVDHGKVVSAVNRLRNQFSNISFLQWLDEPYLSRSGNEGAPDGETIENEVSFESLKKLADTSVPTSSHYNIEKIWQYKIKACEAYASQLPFQFGTKGVAATLEKDVQGTVYKTETLVS